MPDYRFILQDDTGRLSSKAPISETPESAVQTSAADASADIINGVGKRIGNTVVSQALSPLNQATGGLASPVFNLGKAAVMGASTAAVAGAGAAVAIAAVQLAVTKIEERIAKMESKASEANERDNTLMRSGAKIIPTFYEGGFSGVKEVNRS